MPKELQTKTGRLVVPLFNTSFTVGGAVLTGRHEITSGVWIGRLNDEEARRVSGAFLAKPYEILYRLEFHDRELRFNPDDQWWRDPSLPQRLKHELALISCSIRMAPRFESAVADTWNGVHWQREFPMFIAGGSRARHSYLTAERAETWATLLKNWPSSGLDPRLSIALDYYSQSIAQFREDNATSLALAAISLETLLGGNFMTEITRTLAQRGALLVARGEEAVETYARLKKLYQARSKLVHDGKPPTELELVHIHRFMMRALPSMAALLARVGSHKRALEILDESVFARREDLDYLFDAENRWWDYVPCVSFISAS